MVRQAPTLRSNRVQPASQRSGVHRPGLAGDFLADAKNDERRNTANVVASRGCGLVLSIQFGEAQFRFELARGRFIVGRHGDAGAAPGRPEVHDERQIASREMPVEIGCGQFDRLSFKQGKVAFGTARAIFQTIARQANHGVAMPTNYLDWFVHGRYLG